MIKKERQRYYCLICMTNPAVFVKILFQATCYVSHKNNISCVEEQVGEEALISAMILWRW